MCGRCESAATLGVRGDIKGERMSRPGFRGPWPKRAEQRTGHWKQKCCTYFAKLGKRRISWGDDSAHPSWGAVRRIQRAAPAGDKRRLRKNKEEKNCRYFRGVSQTGSEVSLDRDHGAGPQCLVLRGGGRNG